ncbi:MFS transporter [Fodinicola acaciae]|uniref:MFS transporter n=1 Tax=Fodinicola acaciae TaxID=2681555 RepID=UPI001C9E84D0|nr:MFS transporter [Fodinicola acaciae]
MTVLMSPARTAYRWRWLALGALLTAEAMNLLDSTIVQVAGPTIHAELGGAVSDIQWFGTAYTLPFAVLLITGGRLGDLVGRRRVFRIGVGAFALASVACALAPSVGLLIAFRVLQGAAAAMIIPQTIGLIKAMFQGPEMSRALGTIGPVMGLAAVCGPVLGGVLTHADLFGSSWRSVFLVNVPLSLAVLAIAPVLVEDRAPKPPRLDLVGTALAMIGTVLIVYPLVGTEMSALGWTSVVAGLAVLVGFAFHQRGKRDALVEVSLFARRVFPAAMTTLGMFFVVTTGLSLVVVVELELGLRADVLTAGLSLLPWSVAMGIASWIAGAYLVPRFGKRVMFAGLSVLLLGILGAIGAYATASPTAYPTPLLFALAMVGVGVGLFTPAFFTSALHAVGPQEVGSAAGLLNAVQQLGATIGVAILGSAYVANAHAGALHAVRIAFWLAAALLVATAGTAALMREPAHPK